MADSKKITALIALEWLQNIQENDFGTESDIASDTDVYNLLDDNHDNSESESSSDNESLVSESSNSEIFDVEHIETSSEAGITWDLLDPNHNYSGRLCSHNVIREAPGPSAQARSCIFKESVCSA